MPAIAQGRAATLMITLAAVLSACDEAPSAPRIETPGRASATAAGSAAASVTPVRQGATVPFSFVVYAPCANGGQGEVLQANGQLTYRGIWLTTADERAHHAVVETFTGSATGWESGETYDVQTRELAQGSIAYGDDGIPDSGEDMQRIAMRLTSRASGMVIDIVLTAHFVQIPSGEYVLDGWEGTARCR